jgi:Ca2+-binding RTX toxin-like protein
VVNYLDATSAVGINLKTGVQTGIAAGDTYDSIELIQGSSYNDTIAGDAASNNFDGGAGIDTINYADSSEAVNVNLTTKVVSGGDAQGDTVTGFEGVIGSAFNDTLASSTSGHTLQGGAGDDLYLVGVTSVMVNEAAGEGMDEVQTALTSFSIGGYANVEKLTFTGTGNSPAPAMPATISSPAAPEMTCCTAARRCLPRWRRQRCRQLSRFHGGGGDQHQDRHPLRHRGGRHL